MLGVIGLGRMGSRIAARLLDAGHALTVYDLVPKAMEDLVARGAVAAPSVTQVADRAQIIVTSLPGPDEVNAVIAGPGGLLQAAPSGTLVIETSTIGASQCRDLAGLCAGRGIAYLDAPVSGGIAAAQSGELTAMIGGEKSDLERALPYLRCYASRIYHLGPHGSGTTAKLLNQIVFLSYAAVFCEATAFGAADGLDVATLVETLRRSVAGQPLMTGWEKHIESGDFSPGFHISRALKDLELGAAAYAEKSYDAPVLTSALQAFHQAAEAGYAAQDIAALHAVRTDRTAPV